MESSATVILWFYTVFYHTHITNTWPHNGLNIINMTTANIVTRPSFQDKNMGLTNFLIKSLFEERTCTDLVISGASFKSIRTNNLYVSPLRDKEKYRSFLVNNTHPDTQYSLCLRNNSVYPEQACAIPDSWKCDGFSSCPTDECGCGRDSFKCADGLGCISLDQVCDSRPDCLDFSDECPCQQFQRCMRSIHLSDEDLDISEESFCFFMPNCSKINDRIRDTEEVRMLREYFFGPTADEERVANKIYMDISPDRLEGCKANNSIFSSHCKKLRLLTTLTVYNCTDDSSVEALYRVRNENEAFTFCDGIKNCKNGDDEQNCPEMFYCKSDKEPIRKELTCDSVPDCADSSDECNNCTMSSVFSSLTDLIGNRFVLTVLMAEVLLIICLNVHAFIYHGGRLMRADSSFIKVDIIQCITLTIYDTMMGVYLIIVCVKYWEYRGEYCSRDVAWRTSPLCKIAGAISYAASHGSLQVVVAMSVCRSYQCRNVLGGRSIKLKQYLITSVLMNIFNFGMAVVPLIATFSQPSRWTEMFVHEYFFSKNPLLRRGKSQELASLVSLYRRVDLNITETYSVSELFRYLGNMTTQGQLFSPDNITSIGLYGTSSLCYPNLYSTDDAILSYKIVYIVENSIYLLVVIVCYALIARQFLKSQRAVAPPVGGNAPGEDASQDKGFYLSFKVSIVIASQLVCWLPVHGAIVFSFLGIPPSKTITDVFIANIVPLNAIMNPILHTDLMNGFMHSVVSKTRSIKIRLSTIKLKPRQKDQTEGRSIEMKSVGERSQGKDETTSQ